MSTTALTVAKLGPGEPGDASLAGWDVDDTGWLDVVVPGDVHDELTEAGQLDDPHFGTDLGAAAWVATKAWWYRLRFDGPGELGADERLRLVCHGLDTFASVWLNGDEIGQHANMFRPLVLDLTASVHRHAENLLAVRFDPPTLALGVDEIPGFSDFVGGPRVRVRKAQFSFGWDFAPPLPRMGPWLPVEVQRRRVAALDGVQFATVQLRPSQAVVTTTVDVDRFTTDDAGTPDHSPLTVQVSLTDPDTGDEVAHADIEVPAGERQVGAAFTIDHPKLWWTHDLGTPFRYDLRVELRTADEAVSLDEDARKVGIRTVTLDESPDPSERGARFFRFVLNGEPIFARGANWVPADTGVATLEEADHAELLGRARDAHMNMVRVWGGGVYEPDAFYDQCDALGLLVWQEFMFACGAYPGDDEAFRREVELEARHQVRRLRSHPCLALWSGNNEVDLLLGVSHPDPLPGHQLFHDVLPRVVAEEDGRTDYVPTSPSMPGDAKQGDRHTWEVWHGLGLDQSMPTVPLQLVLRREAVDLSSEEAAAFAAALPTNYRNDVARFSSEFGLVSLPDRDTLDNWFPDDELFPHSPSYVAHFTDELGPVNKLELQLAQFVGLPLELDQYVVLSQMHQAEGLKIAVEHYRQRRPQCSGTLIWQLDDCWPATSWSLVDYDRRPKPAWYYARRFFAPRLLSFRVGDDAAELWAVNDTRQSWTDRATVKLATFDGGTDWSRELTLDVPPATARAVGRWPLEAATGSARHYLHVRGSDHAPANRAFLVPVKDLDRPPRKMAWAIEEVDVGYAVTLEGLEGYSYAVELRSPDDGVRYSDNHVDVEPGESRTILVSEELDPTTLVINSY